MNLLVHSVSGKYLKKLETNSIDCIVTDPPYGLQFMGKDWDKALPDKQTLGECLRVLKSGAFAFWMCSPRQDLLSRMITRLDEIGFNVNFMSLYWTYATGFPKAQNISKAIDKKFGLKRKSIMKNPNSRPSHKGSDSSLPGGWKHYPYDDISLPTSKEAKKFYGSYGGYQPKPAVEVIIVTMKPITENTFVEQALKNGKGVTWLGNGKIPFKKTDDTRLTSGEGIKINTSFFGSSSIKTVASTGGKGRFPANLLVSDDVLNDGQERKTGKLTAKNYDNGFENPWTTSKRYMFDYLEYGGDSGSYSRYFDLDMWFTAQIPFFITPKPSQHEKNLGLSSIAEPTNRKTGVLVNDSKHLLGQQERKKGNFHPTVKPISLKAYLIMIGSSQNDKVLDPYVGSGTTMVAARLMKRKCIGIEKNKEYFEIAKQRLQVDNLSKLKKLLKDSLPSIVDSERRKEINKWI